MSTEDTDSPNKRPRTSPAAAAAAHEAKTSGPSPHQQPEPEPLPSCSLDWQDLQASLNQRFKEKNLLFEYDLRPFATDRETLLCVRAWLCGTVLAPKEGLYEGLKEATGISPVNGDAIRTHSDTQASSPRDRVAVSRKAFYEQPFIRSYLYSTLLQYIQEVGAAPSGEQGSDNDRTYARVMAIIQSSGTGKSRAMHEVAATLFTFPMVLRDSNTPEGGFPPGSQDLTTLLCGETTIKGNNISNAPVVARLRTASVLLATAKTCAEWLEEDERNGSPKRLNTPQGWRDELYGNEQSAYDKFYAQVQKTVENMQTSLAVNEEGYLSLVTQFKAQLVALKTRLKLESGATTVVLWIDEAHELHRGVSVFAFQSVLADLKAGDQMPPFAAVLSSTASKMQTLASSTHSQHALASARFLRSQSAQLVRPWCHLSVNLQLLPENLTQLPIPRHRRSSGQSMPKPALKPLPLPKVLRSFEHQIKIGRPLWYSYFKAGNADTQALREMARHKLLKGGSWSPSGLAAALICRLALGPSHTPAGRELAGELVAQHMSRALYIPLDRLHVETAYTAEPILGYTASRIMREDPRGCLDRLHSLTSSCLIQKGPRGELLTKLAFVLAFDKAAPETNSPDQLFKSVTLLEFLSGLANEPSLSSLMHKKPVSSSTEVRTLGDIGQATCVIAQFAKGQGSTEGITDPAIKQSIATSTAIEAPPNTVDIDLLFACVLDENSPVQPQNVVLVVAQSKNRKSPETHVDPDLRFYRDRGYTVVYILHECGGTQPFSFSFKENPAPRDTRAQTASTYGHEAGALFVCHMVGISDGLADPATCDLIAAREGERYSDLTTSDLSGLDAQLPSVFNDLDYPMAEAALGYDLGCTWEDF